MTQRIARPWQSHMIAVVSMAACLGNVIYWAARIVASLWAVFVLVTTANQAHPDWTIFVPVAIVGAAVIWGFGRAARYVLAGQ
jgi:hypothetical protein